MGNIKTGTEIVNPGIVLFQESIFVPDPVISLAIEPQNKVSLIYLILFLFIIVNIFFFLFFQIYPEQEIFHVLKQLNHMTRKVFVKYFS